MGSRHSKKPQKEPDKLFDRERWKEQMREDTKKQLLSQANRRAVVREPPVTPDVLAAPPPSGPPPVPTPAQIRSYDDEALARMRWQLQNDCDAFLLNNILLSVQFFENYEREMRQIHNNTCERETLINEAMVRENKHVFFADRLQECVYQHVSYQKSKGQSEPLSAPRLFVLYDNVEASEPGDTSDYSAVLDAPFYKLQIEDVKNPGYVKLKKIEVLESTLQKEIASFNAKTEDSDDSIYTDSEKESNGSDDMLYNGSKIEQMKLKLHNSESHTNTHPNINSEIYTANARRFSSPMKQVSVHITKNSKSKSEKGQNENNAILEAGPSNDSNTFPAYDDSTMMPRKSILKNSRRMSGPVHIVPLSSTNLRKAASETNIGEDTETSGYRSNCSSKYESSETESDYGYSTLTTSATPKKVELSVKNVYLVTSGVLPDESWTPIEVRVLNDWSDEEDEEVDNASKSSLPRKLYDTVYYLNSARFMNNFIDNFIIKLGSGLGFTTDQIDSALTQGASIYCDSLKTGYKSSYEIFPALAVADWPNAANQWIIRERKIAHDPRTNLRYQWPRKHMVNKAHGTGCLLVPVGFRPKRGFNPDQTLQWKIIFPAAERYLESCLAHSHIRCYLFTLALHKAFMEKETAKIGIDPSHIKNHLFWQCEGNFARWPEDRLGESLRFFVRSFYTNIAQSRLRNYFMENSNEFISIPKPILLKLQRRIADIIETPVMHVLSAVDKLKYRKKVFYPKFHSQRLYDILTCNNPLRILNPNIPHAVSNYQSTSDSEDDTQNNMRDKSKIRDQNYQWKRERQRQMQERRVQMQAKKQKPVKQEREINRSIPLPVKMDSIRRRLVFDFFVKHFIKMARSSERFEAIRQAIIYLEQAHRLCLLLLDEPGADLLANEYLNVIRDLLSDCHRKMEQQEGIKLPPRKESYMDPSLRRKNRKPRNKKEQFIQLESPTRNTSVSPFTFVDVHHENSSDRKRLNDARGEESKL